MGGVINKISVDDRNVDIFSKCHDNLKKVFENVPL